MSMEIVLQEKLKCQKLGPLDINLNIEEFVGFVIVTAVTFSAVWAVILVGIYQVWIK